MTVEPKCISSLLSNFKKRSCLGSKCLAERGEEGFSKNGKMPWIGYPTIVEVILDLQQLGQANSPGNGGAASPHIRIENVYQDSKLVQKHRLSTFQHLHQDMILFRPCKNVSNNHRCQKGLEEIWPFCQRFFLEFYSSLDL